MPVALRRNIAWPALAALLALLAAAAPASAVAHGEGAIVFEGTDGAFEVTVRVLPYPPAARGSVHFAVTPFDPDTKALILGVEVDLILLDSEGNEIYQTRAVNSPMDLQFYDTNLTIEAAGEWTLRVDLLHEDRGSASFTVPLTVIEQALPPSGAAGYVFLGVVLFLLGGSIYLWFRSNQAVRRKMGAT